MEYNLVFTTDRGEWHQQAALRAAPPGIKVTMLRKPEIDTLQAALQQADFLISERSGVIDQRVLDAAQRLKLIQRLGSLYHDIDLTLAQSMGVAVCYQPIEGVIRVAEHLVLQMLAITKQLRKAERAAVAASPEWGPSHATDEDTFAYNWSNQTGIGQIWNRTVGIIGFGEIGVELARRLRGWGCRILYHKRSPLPAFVAEDLGISYQDPETILEESDYLINLLPYLPATRMYFNQTRIQQIKQGAILVSCGSGCTIDETALANAVQSGRLAGAALDTFEFEPLQETNPLVLAARKGANILLTPHTAGGTEDQQPGDQPQRWRDYSNITRYINQEELEYQLV